MKLKILVKKIFCYQIPGDNIRNIQSRGFLNADHNKSGILIFFVDFSLVNVA